VFGKNDPKPHASIGTSHPIFIPRDSGPKAVRSGRDYFFVQVHGAQVAFTGPFWERVKRLIVVSQVNLNHPALGPEGVRAIQRSRDVKKEKAEQLGLNSNLIELVPAVMTHVSVSIAFILDKENHMTALTSLINDDSFLAAVSLAPGTSIVAKTVSRLAQKIIQNFMPAEEREPILQFSGDFNLTAGGMQEGYYAILGSRDERNPLPSPSPRLEVCEGQLLAGGTPVAHLSYVILDVQRTEARTRDLSGGAVWEHKLREAENEAQNIAQDPLAGDGDDERRQAWDKCRNLIREAQALLLADPNYLRHEADSIIKATFKACKDLVSPESPQRRFGPSIGDTSRLWQPDEGSDRAFLGIAADEDLDASLARYAHQVRAARRVLRAAGLR
jgi:hypothetical protein